MQRRMLGRESAARVASVSAQKERRTRRFMAAKLPRAPLDGRHFLSPHPGPLPWGEGESCAVSEQYPRQSLASECAQNTRPAEAVPSPRGLPEGEGQGGGKRSVAILLLRPPRGQGWS